MGIFLNFCLEKFEFFSPRSTTPQISQRIDATSTACRQHGRSRILIMPPSMDLCRLNISIQGNCWRLLAGSNWVTVISCHNQIQTAAMLMLICKIMCCFISKFTVSCLSQEHSESSIWLFSSPVITSWLVITGDHLNDWRLHTFRSYIL